MMQGRLCVNLQWEDRLIFFPEGLVWNYPELFVPKGVDVKIYKRVFTEQLAGQQHRKN